MLTYATLRLVLCGFLMRRIFVFGYLTEHPSLGDDVVRLSSALQHFNQRFLQQRTNTISLTLQPSLSASGYFFDELASRFLRHSTNLKVMIRTGRSSFAHYNILCVDSFEAFLKIDPGSMPKNDDFSEYYIIVLRSNASTFRTEQQKIFDYCFRNYIINVSILSQTDGREVELYTYYPFSENHCDRAVPVLLNPNISVELLTASQLFPNKLKDLHKCRLTVALLQVAPYLMLPENSGENFYLEGIEGRLLHTIAEAMNFSLAYVVLPNNADRGSVFPNGTVTGVLRMLVYKEVNMSIGAFRNARERSVVITASIGFYQTDLIFFVMATRSPWTTYEILVYPFDSSLWVALISILTTLSLLAALLKCKRPKLLGFLFNLPKHAPIPMYLTAALLGVSTQRLPRRNFARFLWSVWQWLTLLLRCAYQCLMFRFLSSQKTVAPPDQMSQLVQRGYKLIAHVSTARTISDAIRGKFEVIILSDSTSMFGVEQLEENPQEKYAFVATRDVLKYYVDKHGKHGVFHVLKETLLSHHLVTYFTKHSFFVPAVNKILWNLRSSGLIEHWASDYKNGHVNEEGPMNEEPLQKAFTMSQLYGAFQILYCMWFLAVVVFMLELLWFRIKTIKILRKS